MTYNKFLFQPKYTICSPTYMTTLLRNDHQHVCDFTSFKYMLIGGSAVSKELYADLKVFSYCHRNIFC